MRQETLNKRKNGKANRTEAQRARWEANVGHARRIGKRRRGEAPIIAVIREKMIADQSRDSAAAP
jgi:hypothetical protein